MTTLSISQGSRWGGVIVFVVCLVAVFSITAGVFLAEDGVQVFLLGLAFCSLLLMLIPIYLDRNYLLVEPHSYVLASVLLGSFFKSFYLMAGYGRSVVVDNRLMLGLTHDVLQYGAFVLLIGLGAYVIGYVFGGFKKRRTNLFRSYRFSYSRSVLGSFVVIFISLVLFALHVNAVGFSFNSVADLSQKRFVGNGLLPGERFSQLSYIYYKLALLSKAPMYLMFYMVVRYNKKWLSAPGLLFMVALFINMALPFFVSNKAGIILPLVDLLVISFLISGKLNWRFALYTLGSAIAIMGVIAAFRGGESIAHFGVLDKIFGNRYFVEITKTAHIVNGVPWVVDFFYGKSFVAWLNVILPESLEFDNKYFADMGFYLGFQIFNQPHSGVTPGIIAECFLNFGLPGVLIGMFIVGLVLSYVHSVLSRSLDNVAIMTIYALFVVRAPAMLFNGSLSTAILKCALDIGSVVIFFMLVRSRQGAYR